MNDLEQDIKGILPDKEFDRRDFIWSALGATAALALSSPASAQAITTDTAGIDAADVMIPAGGGVSLRGYRAMPAGNGPFPVVLVGAEIFGLNPYVKDVVRRLAKAGYYAIVPDLYTRKADLTKITTMAEIMPIVNSKADTELIADYDATLEFARSEKKADVARVAITGFCRGGRTTLVYSSANPKLKAAAAWYGPVGGQANEFTPKSAMDRVGRDQGAGARALRRQGCRHSGRAGREVLRRAEGRGHAGGARDVPRCGPRLPRRLPPGQLPQGGRRGRLGQDARVVQEVRRLIRRAGDA